MDFNSNLKKVKLKFLMNKKCKFKKIYVNFLKLLLKNKINSLILLKCMDETIY